MSDSEESCMDVESCTSEDFLSSSDDSFFDEDFSSDGDVDVDDVDGNVLDDWVFVLGDDLGPDVVYFTGESGPKHSISPESKPIEYLDLFFTREFLQNIVNFTNNYADTWIQNNQQHLRSHPTSRGHGWIKQGKTNLLEIRAFLGVVINMGLIKKANLKLYWDISHPCASTPWFVTHFNRDRFQLLLKFLHFTDIHVPNQQPLNKIYKIQFLVEHFNNKFLYYYYPQRDISIDESMVGYKGKTPHLRQYMPNKRHSRFGIKLWCVSDSTNGYLCQFEIYKGGKDPDVAAIAYGMTYSLVFRLLRQTNFLHQGHHLGIDNYYTSPQLLLDLYAHQTTATGTVRVNRKSLPEICIKSKLKNKEVCQCRKGPLLCVAYQDGKKKPILLSTVAKAGFTEIRNRRGNIVMKPNAVALYNKTMGGVDLGDAQLYVYCVYLCTMCTCLSLNTNKHKPMSRIDFMMAIVESLVGDYFPVKVFSKRRTSREIEMARSTIVSYPLPQHTANNNPLYGHNLVKVSARKKIKCVAGHQTRVSTSWQCQLCGVGLCPACFSNYHIKAVH
ncbi:piggyBac transposable element-derived protein 4-like [Hydra vulgaris]|uniref:PiggyBac transposable element-derived protein 4-like n=1 Tax=Hydra vulgaris TaxID=6087 RepID=A0ABM4CUK4_HYDVU